MVEKCKYRRELLNGRLLWLRLSKEVCAKAIDGPSWQVSDAHCASCKIPLLEAVHDCVYFDPVVVSPGDDHAAVRLRAECLVGGESQKIEDLSTCGLACPKYANAPAVPGEKESENVPSN